MARKSKKSVDLTEIVFILDRSGSMCNIVDDTIGGFNTFIEKQKTEPGKANITTVLFDDKYEVLHDGVPLEDITPMTTKEYFPRGSTALVDAVGKAIKTVENRLNTAEADKRASKVICVVTTDGYENSSREYHSDDVRKLIKDKEAEGWQFIFYGANMDSVCIGASLGFTTTSNFYVGTAGLNALAAKGMSGQVGAQGPSGITGMYNSLNTAVTNYRSSGTVGKIEEDLI